MSLEVVPDMNSAEKMLPPSDAWIHNPFKDGRLKTPTDDRGLVKSDELIELVKSTVHSDYEWNGPLDIHHLYWYADWYNTPELHAFREITVHKGVVPRDFHNWLHVLTVPPEVPQDEIVSYRMQGWDVAKSLFQKSRMILREEKLVESRKQSIAEGAIQLREDYAGVDYAAIEYFTDVMHKHFRGLARYLDRYEAVPEEYRLFFEPSDNLREMTAQLGKLITSKAVNYVPAIAA